MEPVNRNGKCKRRGRKDRKPSRRGLWSGGQMLPDAAGPERPKSGQVTGFYGDLAAVQLMVECRQEWINSRDSLGFHPLHLVLSSQYPQNKSACLKFLLEHKADVNATTDSGQTPLHLAAYEGLLDCTEILVKAGADVLAKDSNGHTPLDLARIWCHRKIARYLKSCSWEAEKRQELKERKLLQALHMDLVDMAKQNLLNKKKLTDEKLAEWANKKGLAPLKDFSPRVRVSQYHTKCLLSAQTNQTSLSQNPWTVFVGFQPEKPLTDLRSSVTLLRDSGSRQLQYTTKWDCTPHSTPNLSQDVVERVLFPRAFPSRIATPQCFETWTIDEVQHRRNPQGQRTCPWTGVQQLSTWMSCWTQDITDLPSLYSKVSTTPESDQYV